MMMDGMTDGHGKADGRAWNGNDIAYVQIQKSGNEHKLKLSTPAFLIFFTSTQTPSPVYWNPSKLLLQKAQLYISWQTNNPACELNHTIRKIQWPFLGQECMKDTESSSFGCSGPRLTTFSANPFYFWAEIEPPDPLERANHTYPYAERNSLLCVRVVLRKCS